MPGARSAGGSRTRAQRRRSAARGSGAVQVGPDVRTELGACRTPGTVGRMAQFVDWDLAAATAGALGKSGPRVSVEEATSVVSELRRLAVEAAGHVESYTGMTPAGAPAPVRVVDRRDWAAANIDGLREVVAPLLARRHR